MKMIRQTNLIMEALQVQSMPRSDAITFYIRNMHENSARNTLKDAGIFAV
jgi:hypothetical protein